MGASNLRINGSLLHLNKTIETGFLKNQNERIYPATNSCLFNFLSPPTSSLAMISVARFFGSLSPLRSVWPVRSYYKAKSIWKSIGIFLIIYNSSEHFCQFLLINLSIIGNVVHIESNSKSIVEITLTCSRDSKKKFIEVNCSIIIWIECIESISGNSTIRIRFGEKTEFTYLQKLSALPPG